MAEHNLYSQYQQQVLQYLRQGHAAEAGFPVGDAYRVSPLAAGEYNLNYLVETGKNKYVFRVNIGTQIARADQIEYEYKALQLLAPSGVTPKPYLVDDSRLFIDRGISIMEFLPGRTLDYRLDLSGAAETFASIHQIEIAQANNHLIVEEAPLSLIFDECSILLQKYFDSDLGVPAIKSYLREILDWAETARKNEDYFIRDPFYCIVNTEVNSGNFLVEEHSNTTYLVDWEMPRWGDPSSDLCHFCSPLTTLWKTSHRLSEEEYRGFIDAYSRKMSSKHLRDTLGDRLQLKTPFVYLRGISWSAMGWTAYQTDYAGIRNEDTWRTLCSYLDLPFIRSLFDPFITGRT